MIDVKETQRSLKRFFRTRYQLMVPNAVWYETEMDMACVRNSGFLDEFEIKMSRSDFKADFKKTHRHRKEDSDEPNWKVVAGNKHDMLQDGIGLPNNFYFVLKEGIATSEEVPDKYGLIWITEKGINVEREATRLHKRKLHLETQLYFAKKLNNRWWDNFMGE